MCDDIILCHIPPYEGKILPRQILMCKGLYGGCIGFWVFRCPEETNVTNFTSMPLMCKEFYVGCIGWFWFWVLRCPKETHVTNFTSMPLMCKELYGGCIGWPGSREGKGGWCQLSQTSGQTATFLSISCAAECYQCDNKQVSSSKL